MRREVASMLFILLIFISSSTAAREEQKAPVTPDWIRMLAGGWYVFIIVAFFLIAAAYALRNTTLLAAGCICLFISIACVMIGYLIPLFGQPTIEYEKCTSMFKPDVPILSFPGIAYITSCILTGYSPLESEWLAIITFIVFGMIMPLALLISLFWEFVPEGLITNKYARNVIAVVGALFAFRGFFITLFIEFLSYGFGGIGALLVAVLFTGSVYKTAYRAIRPLGWEIKTEMEYLRLGKIKELEREIATLQDALLAATDESTKEDIRRRIKLLQEELDKLSKQKP